MSLNLQYWKQGVTIDISLCKLISNLFTHSFIWSHVSVFFLMNVRYVQYALSLNMWLFCYIFQYVHHLVSNCVCCLVMSRFIVQSVSRLLLNLRGAAESGNDSLSPPFTSVFKQKNI